MCERLLSFGGCRGGDLVGVESEGEFEVCRADLGGGSGGGDVEGLVGVDVFRGVDVDVNVGFCGMCSFGFSRHG